MRTEQKFGTSIKAIVAGVALVSGLLVSAVPAGAITTAPALSTMDRTIVGSGSDTTYDLMMALDKVYNAANGCATIWASSASQPFNGQCDTADNASGNGPDKSSFPWVNESHAVIKENYPVGSGVGQNELCKQNLVNVRGVDFARSSSGPATSTTAEKCSDLKYIAYAEDAVTWYHFTKNPDGTDTASARIVSIDQATIKKIFRGEVTLWSQLNGNVGVLDANGNPFATSSPAGANEAEPLPETGIVLYSTQTGSGTYSYFTNSARSNSATKMSAPAPTPVASQTAHAVYSTNQENYPAAIAQDKNTNNAIYFMSVGRYKQLAKITDQESAYSTATATGTRNAGGYADALGQIDGKAPTLANIAKGADKTTGYFPYSRDVFNVTRYASAATNAYVGPDGFLCKVTDSTKDRIKMDGYRTIVEAAIKSEGFAPLPVSAGSYCRVRTANVAVTADDATAPSITLAAPAPSANASGAATFTINFNEPVRATDASKLTVTQSGNSSIAFTTSATNSKSVAVSAFDSGNTNDLDPYANKVVSNLVVNVTGIAYDADGTHPVTVALAAGAVADRNGNSSVAFSTSTASNTAAPVPADTTAPTVADNGSTFASGTTALPGSFKLTFSEPVRNIDLSKFSYVSNAAAKAPVAVATPAAVYSCKTAAGRSTACDFWANNNEDNPSASLAVASIDIKVGKAALKNVSLVIAAGAFNDKAGNDNAAATLKKDLVANNLVVVGTWATNGSDVVSSKANDARTYYVFGDSVNVVLAKNALGGKVSVKIDGVEYAPSASPAAGQISWDLNGSGTATVSKTGLANGYHTVVIKNLGASPTAAGSAAVKATFIKVTVKSVS